LEEQKFYIQLLLFISKIYILKTFEYFKNIVGNNINYILPEKMKAERVNGKLNADDIKIYWYSFER